MLLVPQSRKIFFVSPILLSKGNNLKNFKQILNFFFLQLKLKKVKLNMTTRSRLKKQSSCFNNYLGSGKDPEGFFIEKINDAIGKSLL